MYKRMKRRIAVTVKTRAQKEGVTQTEAGLVVAVRAMPVKGAANERIVKVLAKHLGIAPSMLTLVKGATSKQKTFEYA
jgi:uncharacterized protein YggU (UPF0235/DUF167 family)